MNKRVFASAIVALSVAAGCTDFSPIAENECGNAVLEPGEDCDSFSQFEDADGDPDGVCGAADDSANACFYICDSTTTCPLGWGCGSDNRCRRPSGEFVQGEGAPWRFPVDQLGIGDLDGDGNADLIGLDSRAISVRYGDANGTFISELEFLTRRPTGPATFGSFNDDALTDIVVPTDTGLFVLLGEQERGLDPVAYSPFAFADAKLRLQPVHNGTAPIPELPGVPFPALLLVAGDPSGASDDFMTLLDQAPFPLPPGTVANIPGRIPVADINPGAGPAHDEWVISTAGSTQADVYGTPLLSPNTIQLQDSVTLPGGLHLGTMFAEVDGAGEIDLLVSFTEVGSGRSRVGVARNIAGNLEDTAVKINAFDRPTAGEIPWPLAAGDFDLDGRDDYVVKEAVMMARGVSGQAPNLLVPTTIALAGQWSEATVGDFNGDENLDFAASLDGANGIEVFLGNGTGLFNRFSVSTSAPAKGLRTGDFDGDFIADIAFTERGDLEGRQDEVLVSFGQLSGGPSEPIAMGRLNIVEEVEPIPGLGLFDGDLASDLVVVSSSFPDSDSTALAVLQGSASRRMISPFTLQANDQDFIPHQAVFGQFLEADGFTDIIAVAEPNTSGLDTPQMMGGDVSVVETFVFRIPGQDNDGGLDASGLLADPLDAGDFALRCARWAVGDLDQTGVDELVGIDRAQECAGFDGAPTPQAVVLPNNEPDQASVADLAGTGLTAPDIVQLSNMDPGADDDGGLDYVVLFRGEFRGSTNAGSTGEAIEGSGVSVFWNEGGELNLVSRFSTVQIDDGSRLLGVATMKIDDDQYPDLLILSTGGLWHSLFDPETKQYSDPPLWFAAQPDSRLLASGDLNGDGLDDFAYVYGSDVEIQLAVPADPLGGAL